MRADETVGQLLQQARVSKGLSRAALASELKLPLRHIEAIESDDWASLPPGRPRPLARQLAQRLSVDLKFHTGAFQILPGVPELEPPDPRRERLERVVMGVLTVASALLVVWLVVPGPRLGRKPVPSYLTTLPKATLPPPPPSSFYLALSGARGALARGASERAGGSPEPPRHGHLRGAH